MSYEEIKTERREELITNTKEFRQALIEKRYEDAELFLTKVAKYPERYPQYDARWLDHRQRELFQEYYKAQDWVGAKRIVEATTDPFSKQGRIKRLEQLTGKKYEKIS